MTAMDFEYDGIYLSDLGFIICEIGGGTGLNTSKAGSQLSFTKVTVDGGKYWFLEGAEYGECFETSFTIGKCSGDPFDDDEYAFIMRWLNRKEFHELAVVDVNYDIIRFTGSFNVQKIEICGEIFGFQLSFYSNSPFGRYKQISKSYTVPSGGTIRILDISDEPGFLRPDILKITLSSAGNLTIKQEFDGEVVATTRINGCSNGETITIDGKTLVVTSSVVGKNVYSNFNFVYPKLSNTFSGTKTSNENIWTFSLPCTVELSYSPIRKIVF